jgi:3-oxoacyl-[acyl-carrier protein] reductase
MSADLRISDLVDRAILATGASTGIGAAVAAGLARQGARVVIHYNSSRREAEKLADDILSVGGSVVLVQGDLSQAGTPKAVVGEAARLLGALTALLTMRAACWGAARRWTPMIICSKPS